MKKILFTYVIFLIVLALSKSPNTPNSKELGDGKELALQDMTYTLADSSGVKVSAYDFGEGDLKNSGGKQVPNSLTVSSRYWKVQARFRW
jgi:hypothetical protein